MKKRKQPKKQLVVVPERIGYVDIETSNLHADYGIILTWCIADDAGNIYEDAITAKDVKNSALGEEDYRITASLLQALSKFDRLVGFYSKRYDIPYIRTRAVALGLKFPDFTTIYHTDVYDLVKRRFRLSSNRQENACRNLIGKTEKTHFNGAIWRAATRGEKKYVDMVLDHNRRDVRDLKRLFKKVSPFSRIQKSLL